MCALKQGFWFGLAKNLSPCPVTDQRKDVTLLEESRGERMSVLRDDQPVTDLDLCHAGQKLNSHAESFSSHDARGGGGYNVFKAPRMHAPRIQDKTIYIKGIDQ
jgi:hypothetical protein